MLVDRTSGRVSVMGSAHTSEEWVWLASMGYEEDGDLEIASVHDLERAVDTLRELRSKEYETARDRRELLQTAPLTERGLGTARLLLQLRNGDPGFAWRYVPSGDR